MEFGGQRSIEKGAMEMLELLFICTSFMILAGPRGNLSSLLSCWPEDTENITSRSGLVPEIPGAKHIEKDQEGSASRCQATLVPKK